MPILDQFRTQPVQEPDDLLKQTTDLFGGRKSKLASRIEEESEYNAAAMTYDSMKQNDVVKDAARRFLEQRLGKTNISDEDLVDEVIEHFRSFDVNEMTTAGDLGYVSAAATGATEKKDQDAQMRLADYRLLYQTYRQLPAFYEEGGAENAFDDYLEGLLKAPSTYLGLLLPGIGKGAGIAGTQAGKAAVSATLRQAFQPGRVGTRMIQKMAANPVKTTVAGEAAFGGLQNLAAQRTEVEADLRDKVANDELLITSVASGVLPAAAAVGLAKGRFTKFTERNVEDLLDDADKNLLKKIQLAEEKAEKTILGNKTVAQDLREVLRELDPEAVARGEKGRDKVRDEFQSAINKGTGDDTALIDPEVDYDMVPLYDVIITPGKKKRVFAAGVEILAKTGGRKEGERITEAVARTFRELEQKNDGESAKFLKQVFEDYNLTADDFADLFMADLSAAGRSLQAASAARRVLDAAHDDIFGLSMNQKSDLFKAVQNLEIAGDAGKRKFLEETGGIQDDMRVGILKRMLEGTRALDAARLAFMTSQTATTVRNTIGGAGRIGIDVATKALDRGISKVTGGNVQKANEDVFAIAYGIINKKEAMAIEAVFKTGFTNKASTLFRELQDIADATNLDPGIKSSRLRDIGANLNALNTVSDNMFKRAAFVGGLKRQLNELYTKKLKAGEDVNKLDFNLREITRRGDFGSFFSTKEGKKMLDKAIEDSLYFTYQKTPDSPLARAVINGIHKAPFLTTSLVPFPRFIANAMRFTYEYSPLYLLDAGFVRFAAKNQDNYEEFAKGLVGSGMLMGATAYRMSEHAGENWWEGKKADGSTYDLRPFFPAAPYLFVGDLVARAIDKDVKNLTDFDIKDRPLYGDRNELADAIQALSGTQFRAGMGLYTLDAALREAMSENDPDKIQRILTNATANIVNTYTIPLTFLQDTYNTFAAEDEARIVKNTKSSDMLSLFINKSLARVPGNYKIEQFLAEKLGTNPSEIYQSPTRGEDIRRVTPFSRQLYGVLYNERKNRFEKELAENKISRNIVFSKTGVPEADALISQFMGEYISDYVVPAIEASDTYKSKSRDEKKDFLKRVIQEYRSDILDLVEFNSKQPVYKERYGFDPMEKAAFNRLPQPDKQKALDAYHAAHGEPADGVYDYTKLLYYSKYIRAIRRRGLFD